MEKILNKFANDTKRATYLLLWYLLLLDLVNKINKTPINGNNIKEDKIGKFVI